MLPNFLIIGAMKAGTTSLHTYLSRHPEVFMSSSKELNFFVAERNWSRGLGWYESQFADAGGFVARGEASPIYTMAHAFAGVPQRIAKVVPEAKLIYLLRDPFERIRSHYLHRVAEGTERRSIDRAVREADYIWTTRYAYQLEHYLEHFPRDAILVLTSEDLLHSRRETLRTVFEFIDVDPALMPDGLEQQKHVTADKRVLFEPLRRFVPGLRRLTSAVPSPVKRRVYRLGTRRVRPDDAVLTKELESYITEKLLPDLEPLRRYMASDFDAWGLIESRPAQR